MTAPLAPFANLGEAGAAVAITDQLPTEAGAAVIDFTHASVTPSIIDHCRQHGMALVIGTTGIERQALETMLAEAGQDIPILAARTCPLGSMWSLPWRPRSPRP